jgi:hypothetical protein
MASFKKDYVTFGGTNTYDLDSVKYSWRVLATQGDKELLVTANVIEHRKYAYENRPVTWEDSDLRRYLNDHFYNDYFNDYERAQIVKMPVKNQVTLNNGLSDGGRDTEDNIFILSLAEVLEYFGDSGALKDNSVAVRTIYDEYNNERVVKDLDTDPANWCLRSSCSEGGMATYINKNGGIEIRGGDGEYNNIVLSIRNPDIFKKTEPHVYGVRPALWRKTV